MALILADRIRETTTTTGTGTYTLAGAETGFETFATIGNSNTTYYCCTDGVDFEIGVGTYTLSGTTLDRTAVLQSSNSDSAVSWANGTRSIFCTQPAEKAVFLDANGDMPITNNATIGGTLGVTGVLTGTSLDISGDIDVDGTTNLDVVDIDGAVDMATTLAVAGNVDFNGDLDVDGTTNLDVVDIDGAVDMATTLAVAGNTTVGGTLGVTGVLTGTSLDISGNIDIDGTSNLDIVDIDGAVDMATTLTLAGNADFNGDLDVDGTTNLDVVDIDGAVNIAAATTIDGANKVQFRDTGLFINSSTDGQLDIVADTEIQIAATTVDINGAVALNGAITGATNITLSGELDAATGDFSGDVDVDGTLEADAITVNGTALNTVIAGVTVTNATNSAHVSVADNESTNEENLIPFIEDTSATGNVGLESDGDFAYNPSTGTVSATIFKGNIDAVDGDFDGTLEADAITVGGTALNTVIAGVTVTNATNSAHVSVADNESTDEENLITFIEDASATGNVGLESDGNLSYNPSSGTVTATIFKGNIDAVDGDFDGTLEADAITLNGTAITATATLSTGISNNNVPKFTSGVADDDFLRVAGTAIEGRSASEVLSDIGATTAALAANEATALAIALG